MRTVGAMGSGGESTDADARSSGASAGAAPPPKRKLRTSRRSLWLLLAACVSIGTSAAIGIAIADHQRSPSAAASRAWHGKVTKISRSGAEAARDPGLTVVTPSGKLPLGEGAEI